MYANEKVKFHQRGAVAYEQGYLLHLADFTHTCEVLGEAHRYGCSG
jgi:hypothetical protein